jgi:membrane-bound lytic murein transglycosylase D
LRNPSPSKPVLEAEKNKQSTAASQYPSGTDMDAKEKDISTSTTTNAITHIVRTKETLYSISKKYGVDVGKIQKWNKLDSLNLKTGQELIIYKN